MDFRYVWEDLYRIPLEFWKGGGGTTWRYIAAFLLSLRSTKPDTDTVRRYAFQDKLLGRPANPSVNALPPPRAIMTGKRKQGDCSARREPVPAASTNWPVPIFGRQGT